MVIFMGYVSFREGTLFPIIMEVVEPHAKSLVQSSYIYSEVVPYTPKLYLNLVGGWTTPFEKYDRQNGNLPQIGVKIKNIWVATTQFFLLLLFLPWSWFTGKWLYLKGNYPIGGAHFSLNHDYGRKGKENATPFEKVQSFNGNFAHFERFKLRKSNIRNHQIVLGCKIYLWDHMQDP